VEAVASLTSAGQRVSAAGTQVADHLATDISASKAVLATLPDVRAELTAAVADLRLETAVLTGAAQQISSAGTAATTAVTEAAVRVEIAATTLGAADRSIGASSAEAATQIDRLGGIAQQAETHMARLPGITGEIGATAARLEAATPALERLDTLSQRLESALAEPAAVAQEASVMTLISLSSDLCEAMRRVEASLSAHDSVLPAVASSMAQVEAAVGNVVSALSRPADLVPALDGEPTPAALAATLRRLDEVTSQTEALLQQTEALAEAVLNGRAPGLDALLADRTPVLLAGIDGMTKRMRSVATALALVNDGVPKAGNGLRRAG
jgi:chromosome segregation ATPase